MLLTLLAAAALAQGAPDQPDAAPPPPADAGAAPAATPPTGHGKTPVMDKQTCLTKGLSPDEKKSCCKHYPDMCGTPGS